MRKMKMRGADYAPRQKSTEAIGLLKDVLVTIPDGEMICFGARTNWIRIEPKEDLMKWLAEEKASTEAINELTGEGAVPFLDREVIMEEYEPDIQKAWLVKVKGDENGTFWMRNDKTHTELKYVDTQGAEQLIAEVLAQVVYDITLLDMWDYYYEYIGKPDLPNGAWKYRKSISEEAQKSEEFLRSNRVSRWTTCDGTGLIRAGHQNTIYKIEEMDRRIRMSIAAERRLLKHYNENQIDRITDLYVEGAKPTEILEEVGLGKSLPDEKEVNFKTLQDKRHFLISDYCKAYESQKKREAIRFMIGNGIDPKERKRQIRDFMEGDVLCTS